MRALKHMLFECDARLYRKALEALMSAGFTPQSNEIAKGQRYYVMSKLFSRVVNRMLADQTDA